MRRRSSTGRIIGFEDQTATSFAEESSRFGCLADAAAGAEGRGLCRCWAWLCSMLKQGANWRQDAELRPTQARDSKGGNAGSTWISCDSWWCWCRNRPTCGIGWCFSQFVRFAWKWFWFVDYKDATLKPLLEKHSGGTFHTFGSCNCLRLLWNHSFQPHRSCISGQNGFWMNGLTCLFAIPQVLILFQKQSIAEAKIFSGSFLSQ